MKLLDHFSGARRRQARGKPGKKKAGCRAAPGQSTFDKAGNMHKVTGRAEGPQPGQLALGTSNGEVRHG